MSLNQIRMNSTALDSRRPSIFPISDISEIFDFENSNNHLADNREDAQTYHCSECGKAFRTSSEMNVCRKISKIHWSYCIFLFFFHSQRHARIHTDQRPFQCGICGQRFKNSSNMKVRSEFLEPTRSSEIGVNKSLLFFPKESHACCAFRWATI